MEMILTEKPSRDSEKAFLAVSSTDIIRSKTYKSKGWFQFLCRN
jgi:hypothetical protein